MNSAHWCVSCGGATDRRGRTLAPPVRLAESSHVYAAPSAEDDPLRHLSPVERFNQALDRRDQLVRDRLESDRAVRDGLLSDQPVSDRVVRDRREGERTGRRATDRVRIVQPG